MNGWISVSDRLPEWEETVFLAGWRKGEMAVAKGHRCNVWPDCVFRKPWAFSDKRIEVVTHWQPIPAWPEPPEAQS